MFFHIGFLVNIYINIFNKIEMKKKTCVVIPCYKVRHRILNVLSNKHLSIIDKIILVDDKCPQNTGLFLKGKLKSNKYKILMNRNNLGVGGATITGFKYALKKRFDVIIKIDGDGQHNIKILSKFLIGFNQNKFDFCKGYRSLENKSKTKNKMPTLRFWGAKVLEFLVRLNSGNWNIKDPCHGLIAFNSKILMKINLDKIKRNYFFEQDIIMNVVRLKGRIKQFNNEVIYGDEISNLNPIKSIFPFLFYHFLHFFKKVLN